MANVSELPLELVLRIFDQVSYGLPVKQFITILQPLALVSRQWCLVHIYTRRDSATAYNNLGKTCFNRKQYFSAGNHFTSAIQLDPYNHTYWGNRSITHEKNRKYSQALKDLKKAIILDGLYIKGYMRLGNLYAKYGKWEKAYVVFMKGLDVDPDNEYMDKKSSICKNKAELRSAGQGGLLDKTFINAVKSKNIRKLKRYLRNNVPLNRRDLSGRTVVHHAVESGSHIALQYLIEAGANLSIPDFSGSSPLDLLLALHVGREPGTIKCMRYEIILKLMTANLRLGHSFITGRRRKQVTIEELN